MSNNNIGLKIKEIRESKNISIEDVSERCGLSEKQIVSVENNENLPSLGTLIKIARALGVRLGTFLDDNDNLGPIVCRAEDRENSQSISFSNDAADARINMVYHPMAKQKAGRHMEPFFIEIQSDQNVKYKSSAHEGEEFVYVVSGEIEIDYGKNKYTLKEGDSIYFDSIVEHHIHSTSSQSAKVIAVVYVPF